MQVLLCLMYHRVGAAKHSDRLDVFRDHLRYLAEHCPVVLPGDPLPSGKMSVCLTFDDAFFDFYYHVFPILSELKIKALLAVPVKYLVNDSGVAADARLQVPYEEAMKERIYQKEVPFCTWAEISEMVKSGHVEVASHSYSHADLTAGNADLNLEIAGSKAAIENKLGRKVTTFVYPFGKIDKEALAVVRMHYAYSMRIGSALNKDWQNANGIVYRVDADNLPDPVYPLKKRNLLKYYLKYLSNTFRGR